MTDKATHMEAQLRGLSKASDKDGDWFKLILWIHPDDFPDELFKVKLRSRLGVAMVQIADDETAGPVKSPEKRKFEDLPPSQQAGIRCNEIAFQSWCAEQLAVEGFPLADMKVDADLAASYVRRACCVASRSDLNDPRFADDWHALDNRFIADTRLPEQR